MEPPSLAIPSKNVAATCFFHPKVPCRQVSSQRWPIMVLAGECWPPVIELCSSFKSFELILRCSELGELVL
ncbi:hypothetical protein V6N11_018732 [Hibiscus sabdariffa]|uniref:Uncharacterized protein n=1 Tax=Hibiscus sabdariffa TaxID=183260 RepID=A0ABR2QT42_9ROSI